MPSSSKKNSSCKKKVSRSNPPAHQVGHPVDDASDAGFNAGRHGIPQEDDGCKKMGHQLTTMLLDNRKRQRQAWCLTCAFQSAALYGRIAWVQGRGTTPAYQQKIHGTIQQKSAADTGARSLCL